MRGMDEDDFTEIGQVIVGALGDAPNIDALRSRIEALCAKRPLYPGFRGWTTYVT
jgi:glycine hydroxymethyltransferase